MVLLKNLSPSCVVWLFLFKTLSVEGPETSGTKSGQERNKSDRPSSSYFAVGGITGIPGNEEQAKYDELFGGDALHHYTAATETYPSEWLYHRLRGLCFIRMRNFDAAVPSFREAISRSSEGNTDRILLCLTLFKAQKFDDVKKELDTWPHTDLITLGNIFYSQNKLKEAILCYDAAIEKNSEEVSYYEKRAACHRECGAFSRAIADYEKIISKAPGKLKCRISLAKTLIQAGDPDRAIKEIFSTSAEEIAKLGDRFSSRKKFGGALKCYNEAIKRQPGNHHFYWKRGLIFLSLQKMDETIDDFKKSLLLIDLQLSDNESPSLRRLFLIELLLDSGRFNEAIGEMVSIDHSILYTLADGMFKIEKFEQALHCCTEAINKVQPTKKIEYYLLRGNCYWKLNDVNAAIDDFKEAVRLDTSNLANSTFWMDFCDLLLLAGRHFDAKIILEERIKKSTLTKTEEIKCEEIQRRIFEMIEKLRASTEYFAGSLPNKTVDSELMELLARGKSTAPSSSAPETGDKNQPDSQQLQKDKETIVEKNFPEEAAANKTGGPSSEIKHKSPLGKGRGKSKLDFGSSTPASTDLDDDSDEELLNELKEGYSLGSSSSSDVSSGQKKRRRRRRKKDSNQLLKLAVTNLAKDARKKAKKKSPGEKSHSVSRENMLRNTDREWDTLYQFADIVLKAHENDLKMLQNSSRNLVEVLETAFADPKILATGDSNTPGLTFKTRSIDDFYGSSPLEICSTSQPPGADVAEPDFVPREWADEWRNINDFRQRAIARKAIDEILSEAQSGTLHEDSIQISTISPSHGESDEEWTE